MQIQRWEASRWGGVGETASLVGVPDDDVTIAAASVGAIPQMGRQCSKMGEVLRAPGRLAFS